MLFKALATSALIFVDQLTQALSQDLKDIRSKFDPEDRWNEKWLDWLHEYVYELGDEDTFHNSLNRDGDMDRPEELDVIYMTGEMYAEIFNGPQQPTDTWYVSFIRESRSQDNFWMCAYLVNVMRVIADEYGGKVRFAMVNTPAEEELQYTFGVRTLPQQFLYKDGLWYEQHMMQILYNNIVTFIEGEYLNEEKVYQTFESPILLNEYTLKIKYVYNWIWVQWFDNWSWQFSDFAREQVLYDGKNLFQLTSPHLSDMFEWRPIDQVNFVCKVLLVAALKLILMLYLFIKCCICRCCCAGSAKTVPAVKQP